MSPGLSDPTNAPGPPDGPLHAAILAALDGVLGAFELEPLGGDRFRVIAEPDRFDRVFGGQVVAQALRAACATVTAKDPHSLHAYFVEAGAPREPLDLVVERVRDGRSISTRRVTAVQGERPLLIALASFHIGPAEPELAAHAPPAPRPEQLPLLQDWVRAMPPEQREQGQCWVDQPPPLELRIGEAPNFLGGPSGWGERSHWMRLPRPVGDDPVLHAVLLAYASDYLLLDMVPRSDPGRSRVGGYAAFSLDHAMWFHAPVRLDRWHLYSQQTQAIAGHRGLVRGAIHGADGRLVASVMQEVLVRPPR